RSIKTFFHQLHVQKPAKQQIVVQLLAKLPLASHRVKRDQQQRLQDLLGSHRGPSHCGIHSIKNPRQFQKLLILHCLDFSERMIGRNTPFYRDQSQHACLFVLRSPHSRLQRYNLRHLNMRHDLQSRKILKRGVFQHPASSISFNPTSSIPPLTDPNPEGYELREMEQTISKLIEDGLFRYCTENARNWLDAAGKYFACQAVYGIEVVFPRHRSNWTSDFRTDPIHLLRGGDLQANVIHQIAPS